MKKLLILALCFVFALAGCSVTQKDTTGDVKSYERDEAEKSPDELHKAWDEKNEQQHEQEDTAVYAEEYIDGILELLGDAQIYTDSACYDNVWNFALAVMSKDTEAIASYTLGEAEYYDFLKDVDIDGFEVDGFEFSSERCSALAENGIYNGYNDKFIVTFFVGESSSELFPENEVCSYYIECGADPEFDVKITHFIPIDQAILLYSDKDDMTKESVLFIDEFLPFYEERLYDGRNYPSEFDLINDVHLITHLMARSGRYKNTPPYSLDEINSFISESFDGNEGISLDNQRDIERWLHNIYNTPEDEENGRFYGCSYAHGGSEVEYIITDIEKDGNFTNYYVNLYCDYSKLAISKTIVLTFEEKQGNPVKLLSANVIENTGRLTVGYEF